jgi:RNA polymerase sigma factor (sigma-70 family)
MLPNCRDGLRGGYRKLACEWPLHSRLTVTKMSESGRLDRLMRVKLEVAEVPDGLTVYTTTTMVHRRRILTRRQSLGGAPFPQTRYSLVADLRSDGPERQRTAYDLLVAAYWKPVFKYVRLKWHADPEEAADLTQGFFLRAFEKRFFAAFDPARARFRTFLRTCLDGFVANERKAERRLKRGGDRMIVPLDFDLAERELQQQRTRPMTPLTDASAPVDFDAFFHREWLRSLFAAAADRLRDACDRQQRPRRFILFARYDLIDDEDQRPTYAQLAADLGLTATTVTNELAAARRDFRRHVLEVLREQCPTDEAFAAEAQALTGSTPDAV